MASFEMASFDFAPLTRRYAELDERTKRCMNPPTVRPEHRSYETVYESPKLSPSTSSGQA